MRTTILAAVILSAFAALAWVSRSSEPRIRITEHSPARKEIGRIANLLSEDDAIEFRKAANRLMAAACRKDLNADDWINIAADSINGKTAAEVISEYRKLPAEAKRAADAVHKFDREP